ncbi:fasciclin domain-containing protein [Maribacter algicola]|uniref:Fasciclin domain-containing protein n=1 Tax=Meishania litoralis TaxID=3434685 RepID=A0ACC7LKQ1_9FLAO
MQRLALPLCFFLILFSLPVIAQTNNSNPETSILTSTESSVNHKTLLAAMRATELDKLLSFDGQYTVFAPSDKAFQELSHAEISELLKPENRKKLHELVAYHIVAGKLSASKILRAMCRGNGKATFTTVQGEKITATMDGIDIVLTDPLGNRAKIIMADADQCNGVIHEIDSVILPRKI